MFLNKSVINYASLKMIQFQSLIHLSVCQIACLHETLQRLYKTSTMSVSLSVFGKKCLQPLISSPLSACQPMCL